LQEHIEPDKRPFLNIHQEKYGAAALHIPGFFFLYGLP
jgi:hypothetical protein